MKPLGVKFTGSEVSRNFYMIFNLGGLGPHELRGEVNGIMSRAQ
ncbi:MAG: hypothetical protein N3F04_07540 [Candidatus Nezhaarchaeota archaeon]|nr:hypothetical protein [Candidatus Nezhaarchaeota archaeon]MCX8142598.1 hypothetical protein [Candidatus Nezhaarchaeota archaeon]